MKVKILVFAILVFGTSVKGQDYSDLFEPTEVNFVWLGVDYSQVKLIGSFDSFNGMGSKNADQIRDVYFPAWNNIILSEASKYDIKGAIKKKSIEYDIDMINEINSKSTPKFEHQLSKKSINISMEEMVKKYDFTGMEGIGLLFIAQRLEKDEGKIYYAQGKGYYTFLAINLQTKEPLLTMDVSGSAGGFGLKNYWAGTLDESIKKLKSSYRAKASEWKKSKKK